MENKTKKMQFLQLQFCTLLVICTLLPDFSSIAGDMIMGALGGGSSSWLTGPGAIVVICKIIGLIGACMAAYAFYQQMKDSLSPVFMGALGGGLALATLTLIPGIPGWLDYIALIALLVAFFMAKGNLGITWNSFGGQGAYLILLAVLLHVYHGIDDKVMVGIAALIGLVVYLIGLGKLGMSMDADGSKGVSILKIAVWIGIVAVIFGWLPLVGGIIAGILGLIAFIIEFLGYSDLRKSDVIQAEGREGASKLRLSMIIMVVAVFIGLFPLTGLVESILSLAALWFVFKGWTMIFAGLEYK